MHIDQNGQMQFGLGEMPLFLISMDPNPQFEELKAGLDERPDIPVVSITDPRLALLIRDYLETQVRVAPPPQTIDEVIAEAAENAENDPNCANKPEDPPYWPETDRFKMN